MRDTIKSYSKYFNDKLTNHRKSNRSKHFLEICVNKKNYPMKDFCYMIQVMKSKMVVSCGSQIT